MFFDLRKSPRYNPDQRNTFRVEDWRAVVATTKREVAKLGCAPLVGWIDELRTITAVAVGDMNSGYIIAPVSAPVSPRLRDVAARRGVPIDDLGEPAACAEA